MSIEQLITEHLDIWTAADTEKKSGRGRSSGSAGSVYGIKKLRELILELAVRGKLVPQDANDEPASELLKRIAAEKAKLVAEGKIKKSKPLADITDDEKPFELPFGWEWVRLDNISPMPIIDGDWIESKDQDVEGEIRLVQLADVGVGEFKDKSDRFINLDTFNRLNCTQLQTGDILIARLPNPIGRACVFPDLNQMAITVVDIAILRLLNVSYDEYVVHAINSNTFRAQVEAFGKGATRFRVATGNLKTLLLPLPPIAEQHRIVAKVDELMALCDQLENQHNNAAEAHEKLVTHLLGTLTQSQNAKVFNTNWQRISEHFDTLFTTEASIDALKQTLLQLAVMGKLVPQDPNDEPASELLKRIQAEKAKLVAEGKIKKSKPLAEITDDEKPFELPVGWEWVRLAVIGFSRTGRTPSTQNSSLYDGPIPFIGPGQITLACELLPTDKWLSEAGRKETTIAKTGDILMVCIGGSIGKSAIADKEMGFNQQINCISPLYVESKFAHISMMANSFQSKLLEFATGSATPIINKSKWEELLVPVSPLIEQHRIVIKVDELMAICDQLKLRLTEADLLQHKLADVMVEQAIS